MQAKRERFGARQGTQITQRAYALPAPERALCIPPTMRAPSAPSVATRPIQIALLEEKLQRLDGAGRPPPDKQGAVAALAAAPALAKQSGRASVGRRRTLAVPR